MAELNRQVREWEKRHKDLAKDLAEEERKVKENEVFIKLLDSENQAVQLQVCMIIILYVVIIFHCMQTLTCDYFVIICQMCILYT